MPPLSLSLLLMWKREACTRWVSGVSGHAVLQAMGLFSKMGPRLLFSQVLSMERLSSLDNDNHLQVS
jgi:hypothetical protein